jgi:hypothetical protein
VKEIILKYLPNAVRVVDVCYEPQAMSTIKDNASKVKKSKKGREKEKTVEDFIVIFRVIRILSLSDEVTSRCPQAQVQFNGRNLLDRPTGLGSFSVLIPKGTPVGYSGLRLLVTGSEESENDINDDDDNPNPNPHLSRLSRLLGVPSPNPNPDDLNKPDKKKNSHRELGSKNLPLLYLINTPSYAIDHTIDSTISSALKTLHIAKIRTVSKLFPSNLPVAFLITGLSLRDLLLPPTDPKTGTQTGQSLGSSPENSHQKPQTTISKQKNQFIILNIYIIIKWKGQEVGRSSVIRDIVD